MFTTALHWRGSGTRLLPKLCTFYVHNIQNSPTLLLKVRIPLGSAVTYAWRGCRKRRNTQWSADPLELKLMEERAENVAVNISVQYSWSQEFLSILGLNLILYSGSQTMGLGLTHHDPISGGSLNWQDRLRYVHQGLKKMLLVGGEHSCPINITATRYGVYESGSSL